MIKFYKQHLYSNFLYKKIKKMIISNTRLDIQQLLKSKTQFSNSAHIVSTKMIMLILYLDLNDRRQLTD